MNSIAFARPRVAETSIRPSPLAMIGCHVTGLKIHLERIINTSSGIKRTPLQILAFAPAKRLVAIMRTEMVE